MKDCMLDLETLGRTADSVILQIGLCWFDIRTGEVDDGFEVNIDLNDSLRQGFGVDGSTIEWWMDQDRQVQALVFGVFETPRYSVKRALIMAQQYMKPCETLWSHATFDAPMLSYHFHKMNVKLPIHYRGHRDIRTLMDLARWSKLDYEFFNRDEGVRHTALADCKRQIRYCHECWKRTQYGRV